MKQLAILGSTGSIGQNCLSVVDSHPGEFGVKYLATNRSVDLLVSQALEHHPRAVGVVSGQCSETQREQLESNGAEVWLGSEALERIAGAEDYDLLVNAVVGAAGLLPTLKAIEAGKNVALANKETLVVGGEIVMTKAQQAGVSVIPIDSEHSAIFQCLLGEEYGSIRRIILTASGGPFLHVDADRFVDVTVEQALSHPNWSMGKKITIDSATMMNKGLEVIEAHWLFGLPLDSVQVVIHPQSIVHSMVEFMDGSIKAQLGLPDMRLPIQFALTYPERRPADFPALDFTNGLSLEFHPPDYGKFKAVSLAYEAAAHGGTMPAVMNAANEVAVGLFLEEKIRFNEITALIEQAMKEHEVVANPGLDELLEGDSWAREYVFESCKK